MLVKYINENSVEYANNKQILKYNYKQIINPKDENFIKAGYKPLEIEEEPTYNIETEYLQSYYVEEEYINDIFKMIDNDNNSFYYVMMAKAWLISECYIK